MPDVADSFVMTRRDDVVLVTTDAGGYTRNLCRLVMDLRSRYGHGAVITANRPYSVLRRSLAEAGASLDGLEFVDCVSALTGRKPTDGPGVTFIGGPLLLELIMLRTQQLVRAMPEGQRFVLVDSVSTLRLYNGVEAVAEMTHALSTHMRLLGVPTVLLALEEADERPLHHALAAYCDRVMNCDERAGRVVLHTAGVTLP